MNDEDEHDLLVDSRPAPSSWRGRCCLLPPVAGAQVGGIEGLTGTNFALTAKGDRTSTADGGSLLLLGPLPGRRGRPQYPGPTLIVNQGDAVTVNLTNALHAWLGRSRVARLPGPGPAVDGHRRRRGTAAQRGRRPEAVDGRPSPTPSPRPGPAPSCTTAAPGRSCRSRWGSSAPSSCGPPASAPSAGHRLRRRPDAAFDHEYLFLLSRDGPAHPRQASSQGVAAAGDHRPATAGELFPNYWFINGRNAPDTMASRTSTWLPTQPYNSHAAHAPRRAGAHAGHRRRARPAPVPPPRQPRPRDRRGRPAPRRARRARARRPRRGRGLHDPVGARPDRGRDLHLDRQGPGLGHLRHPRRTGTPQRHARQRPGRAVHRASTRSRRSTAPTTASRSR